MEIFALLKSHVHEKKGFTIHFCRYNDQNQKIRTVSGYFNSLTSVMSDYDEVISRIGLKNAKDEKGDDIDFIADYIMPSTNEHRIFCDYFMDSKSITYEIYPSKQEIQIKLTNTTKLSKNIINKIINL